jgi:preprotein translocase subunit SecY
MNAALGLRLLFAFLVAICFFVFGLIIVTSTNQVKIPIQNTFVQNYFRGETSCLTRHS